MSEETWLPIEGFTHYEVSSFGRVRRDGQLKTLTVFDNPRGRRPWVRVTLYVDGKASQYAVHVLVATAFLGERPKGKTVQFKNGISTDVRADNLYYGKARADIYMTKVAKGRIK
jgi:hypothetical protein